MSLYEKYLLPKLINMAMKAPDLAKLRGEIIPIATGKVLEVGIGSGLNLPFYRSDVQISGVDPSLELQAYAKDVAIKNHLNVDFFLQGCVNLPFGNDCFDTVVVTWTFCSISNPAESLNEIRRVLKSSGKMLFIEHGLSKEEKIARWQNRINPMWKVMAGGCHLNRQPDQTIESVGFKIKTMKEGYIPGPKIATYNYYGIASPG